VNLDVYENVLILQDDGERLNRFDGGQRKRFAGAQRKASAVQWTNDSFPIDFTFRQTRPLVRTDIADRKIFAIQVEYGDWRIVNAFHAAQGELRYTADSSQSHGKMKSQKPSKFKETEARRQKSEFRRAGTQSFGRS
jgi:hypothetical protein